MSGQPISRWHFSPHDRTPALLGRRRPRHRLKQCRSRELHPRCAISSRSGSALNGGASARRHRLHTRRDCSKRRGRCAPIRHVCPLASLVSVHDPECTWLERQSAESAVSRLATAARCLDLLSHRNRMMAPILGRDGSARRDCTTSASRRLKKGGIASLPSPSGARAPLLRARTPPPWVRAVGSQPALDPPSAGADGCLCGEIGPTRQLGRPHLTSRM